MTWDELAEFIAALTPEERAVTVALKPNPVAEVLRKLPAEMFLSCAALPPTKDMGGPWLYVATEP